MKYQEGLENEKSESTLTQVFEKTLEEYLCSQRPGRM